MKKVIYISLLLTALFGCNKQNTNIEKEVADSESDPQETINSSLMEVGDSAALHGTSYLDNDETYNVDSIYNRVKEYDHDVNCDRTLVLPKQEVVVEEKPVSVDKANEPKNMAMVEQKPMFPGGDGEMVKWIADNIIYPSEAAEEGVSGRVIVSFIVEKDGSITDIKVVRGKHPALDEEAVRVVKKMPKWIPGRNNGEPERVIYTLPITFKSH